MYLFLVGLFSIAICSQIFRKSDEFCPNEQIKYMTILSAPSLVLCALYCDVDKVRCSRYVYDNLQKKCMLYNGLLGIQNDPTYTTDGQSLFINSYKGMYY